MSLSALVGPPGTGKTTAIAREISEQIAAGLAADRLLCISFTRAAAEQLRTRCHLDRRRGTTMHSLAWRVVADHHGDRPRLVDDMDRDRERGGGTGAQSPDAPSFHDWLTSAGHPAAWAELDILLAIDTARNRLDPVADWPGQLADAWEQRTAWKTEHGLSDFTDVIAEMGRLCARPPDDPWMIWIDEAQDLTRLEMSIVTSWADHTTVRLVGDDDQALYGWRGSDPRASLGAVPAEKVETLGTSWRCPPRIATAAQRWMDRATWRVAKTWDPRPDADKGRILSWSTWDLGRVAESIDHQRAAGRRCMIIAAENWVLDQWAAQLRRAGILHGGDGSRWASAHHWGYAGVGGGLRALLDLAASDDGCIRDPRAGRAILDPIRAGALDGITKTDAIATCSAAVETNPGGLGGITRDLLDHWAADPIDWTAPWRWWARHLLAAPAATAAHPLAVIDRSGPDVWRRPQDHTPVSVTTIHGAKGLEADIVVLDGRRSRTIDDIWRDGTPAERDEIRRVLYVGMTRARHELWLLGGRRGGITWGMLDHE